ncbi:MAG: pyridoxal-phosphate dependent enzyme [Burkholderiaceae bacterium]|nr:pyridoxal-phosphate dependent enzyme [Burkholderiaceae bacterium]
MDVEYDLDKVELHDSPNPYIRFADLLPIRQSHDRLPADARYTPTIHAERLGRHVGMPNLFLKNDTVLPTCSTKDRMAAVSLAFLWECGVRAFCTSSTGNSSTSYAYAIKAYPEMRLFLFTAESFLSRLNHADHGQVTNFCLRDASFVDAFDYAGIYAREHGLVSERGFFNLGRREGLKLSFLEASEQVDRPIDWYVQAVSSAMGVYGNYKAAGELHRMKRIERMPRTLCVQQESCAPMAHAFSEGSATIEPRHIVPKPSGIAEAILRGDPTRAYPHIYKIVRESGGSIVSVTEAEIREARRMMEDLEGVSLCFSSSTAVAGLIKHARNGGVPRQETVLINLTGADRRGAAPPVNVNMLRRGPAGWQPDEDPDPRTVAL